MELSTLRDQLKTALSGVTAEPNAESQPTAPQLAERIKALKAAHTIDATPQRVEKPRAAGEEPVTTRIRRRSEAIVDAAPQVLHIAEASPAGTTLQSEQTDENGPGFPSGDGVASNTAEQSHQERVKARNRQQEMLVKA